MLNSSRVSALEVFKNHSGVKQFSQETDDYKYRVIHSRTNKFQKTAKTSALLYHWKTNVVKWIPIFISFNKTLKLGNFIIGLWIEVDHTIAQHFFSFYSQQHLTKSILFEAVLMLKKVANKRTVSKTHS